MVLPFVQRAIVSSYKDRQESDLSLDGTDHSVLAVLV